MEKKIVYILDVLQMIQCPAEPGDSDLLCISSCNGCNYGLSISNTRVICGYNEVEV